MPKVTIEELIREQLSNQFDDSKFVEALMHMHGWVDGCERSPGQIASWYGIESSDLRQYSQVSNLGLRGIQNPPLYEALDNIAANLPLGQDELPIFIRDVIDVTDLENFSVLALMNACDSYGINVPFSAVASQYHKWLFSKDDRSLIDYAEQILPDIVAEANRFGILHGFGDRKVFTGLFATLTQVEASQVINACPHLSTATYPFIFAHRPNTDSDLVRRLNRIVMFLHPTPVPLHIVVEQLSRGVRFDIVPQDIDGLISSQAVLAGFIEQCEYYRLEGSGVISTDPRAVDSVLSPNEAKVVEALIDYPNGVSFDELEEFSRRCRINNVNEVERVLVSSPAIVSLDSITYQLLNSEILKSFAPDEAVDDEFPRALWGWNRSDSDPGDEVQLSDIGVDDINPALTTIRSSLDELHEQINNIDVRKRTSSELIPIVAGPLTDSTISELENNGQKWTPVLDSYGGKCIGVISTKRLRNKLQYGIPCIETNDYKIKGAQVPPNASRNEILEAYADGNICVFFNDPALGWGVVFPRDLA